MNYFKILTILQKGDKQPFDVPVAEQQAFLERMGEVRNDIDRGYNQYLCQNFFVPKWKVWTLNVIAAVLLPFLVVYYLSKGLFVKKEEQTDIMIERKGMSEVVPAEVREKYHPNDRYWNDGASMAFGDFGFLVKLIVHAPHHPYFVLKAWMNVAHYSDMIRRHSPSVMIQFGEFSFSSSLLTAYCHRHGVKHVDIMHGEKLYFIRDAFFHYDECYVWDKHYVDLFCKLKAEPSQFRIAIPESISIDTTKYVCEDYYADYKYYLATITEGEIKSIVDSMAFAGRKGESVKYRPHPRYTDMVLLKKYVKEEDIEYPKKVGILESISNLKYAVGSYTTVLNQAFFSGQKVILDDVTYGNQHNKLKSMMYILANKNLCTLSMLQS